MSYPRIPWTKEEECLLKKLYNTEAYEQIAGKLGKTAHGVKKKAVALGLHEKKHSYKFWTGLEEEKLKILYPDNSNVDLALVFSVTQQAIQGKARKLGLQKSKNFRPRIMSEIMKGNQRAIGLKHSEQTKKVMSQKLKEFRAKSETKRKYREWWDNLTEEEQRKIVEPAQDAMAKTKETSIERMVAEILQLLNIEYEQEKRIGKYIADFYIPAQNLIIECDGDYWHSLPDVKKRDKQKDKYLRKQGYTVKRLPEKVIKNDKHTAVKQALGS